MMPQLPVRPELSEEGRKEMREKARRNGAHCYAHMSDEWVANAVRMLFRTDLDHESICQASRDRIMSLSLQVEELANKLNDREALIGDLEKLLGIENAGAELTVRTEIEALKSTLKQYHQLLDQLTADRIMAEDNFIPTRQTWWPLIVKGANLLRRMGMLP